MDASAGLSALTAALSTVKALSELDKQLDRSELKLRMATLYGDLADARIALSDARETIRERDEKIRQLSDQRTSLRTTVSHRGYNFGIGDNGRSVGRPYCPVCEQAGTQIQLTKTINGRVDQCPKCRALYTDHPYRLPDELQPSTGEAGPD